MLFAPLTTLALWSILAASAAGLGVLALAPGHEPRPRELGWANALAAGLMLGVAYPLMTVGLDAAPLAGSAGAVAGIAFLYVLRAVPKERLRAVAASAVHSAPEGVAIGAAMAIGVPVGLFLVVTLAVHNVSEGAVLSSALVRQGASRRRAAALAVAAKSSQVAFALAAFALATLAPATLPWLLGFAFGALVYLLLVDLLPDSYVQAGRTSIAVVVSVAAGIAALLGGRTL